MEDLRRDVSSVDWGQRRHAGGRAHDVPDMLERLESSDAPVREEALDELWSALCHQETVYSASAAAVPFLFRAAQGPLLTELQRHLVLALLVCIGRGEDGTWHGYTSREEVEMCERAVARIAPHVVSWSVGRGVPARTAALKLCVYFPDALHVSGVSFGALTDGLAEPRLAAACRLAAQIVEARPLDEAAVRAAAETDAQVLEYLDEALEGLSVDAQARGVILELLDRGVESRWEGS